MAASAAAPERKMLEQGKMWVYVYHHFEENETGYDESEWESYYQLDGDIVIDERQYMKMYRWDDRIMMKGISQMSSAFQRPLKNMENCSTDTAIRIKSVPMKNSTI